MFTDAVLSQCLIHHRIKEQEIFTEEHQRLGIQKPVTSCSCCCKQRNCNLRRQRSLATHQWPLAAALYIRIIIDQDMIAFYFFYRMV